MMYKRFSAQIIRIAIEIRIKIDNITLIIKTQCTTIVIILITIILTETIPTIGILIETQTQEPTIIMLGVVIRATAKDILHRSAE